MDRGIMEPIEKFRKLKIMVLGDAMLDRYLSGSASRLAREAPMPIVEISRQSDFPGGAANAAINAAHLGAEVFFVSVVGRDEEGASLLGLLKKNKVRTDLVCVDRERKTLTKQRVSAGDHMLARFDSGTVSGIFGKTERSVIDMLTGIYSHMDGVLVSDYGYGLATDGVIEALHALQSIHKKVLVVDSKYLGKYRALKPAAVKPNYQEAINLLGLEWLSPGRSRASQLAGQGARLLEATGSSVAAVTMDVEGSMVFEKGKPPYRTYTVPQANSRAIGSGDTYASALALALAAGLEAAQAAELAAGAATVVIHKEGTVTCSDKELLSYFSGQRKHIQNDAQLKLLAEKLKAENKRVVFTNGCFDIIHSGHVNYLSTAKSFGDLLIVGMNSDESIRRLKGPSRPINRLTDRIQVLSAFSSIDYVVAFSDDTPVSLIKKIKPDVYVKGGDYTRESLPETPVVESLGGQVIIVPLVPGRSTTRIIKKIQDQKLAG